MKKPTFLNHYWPILLLIANAFADGGGRRPVNVSFDATGLTSITYQGFEFLVDGSPRVGPITMGKSDGSFEDHSASPIETSFDAARLEHTQRYTWGTARFRYEPLPTRLNLIVTVENDGADAIEGMSIQLLDIRFPETPRGRAWTGTRYRDNNVGRPTILTANYGTGILVLCNDRGDRPLQLGFESAGEGVWSVRTWRPQGADSRANGRPQAYDLVYSDRPVAAGATDKMHLSLRFLDPGADVEDACDDVYKAFAAAHPPTFEWEDRRPINRVILTQGKPAVPNNPRRWLNAWHIDVRTDEGLARFRDRMLTLADRIIENSIQTDAQGVIVWDLEGAEFFNITYVGSPHRVGEFAPEMDAIADEFFRKFLDAGLRTGVTLRPTVIGGSRETRYRHNFGDPVDYVERFSEKIRYARERWGCTLFYIDSSGIYRPRTADRKWSWRLISADLWQQIRAANPGILLIPENEYPQCHAHTAPYNELKQGTTATPAWIRRAYPHAATVISLAGGDLTRHRRRLVEAIRQGDIIMWDGWNVASTEIKRMYEEAADAPSGAPHGWYRAYKALIAAGLLDPDTVEPAPGFATSGFRGGGVLNRHRNLALLYAFVPRDGGAETVLEAVLSELPLAGSHRHVWHAELGLPLRVDDAIAPTFERGNYTPEWLQVCETLPMGYERGEYTLLLVRGADTPQRSRQSSEWFDLQFTGGEPPRDLFAIAVTPAEGATAAALDNAAGGLRIGGGRSARYPVILPPDTGRIDLDVQLVSAPVTLLGIRHAMRLDLRVERENRNATPGLRLAVRDAGRDRSVFFPAADLDAGRARIRLAWRWGHYEVWCNGRRLGELGEPLGLLRQDASFPAYGLHVGDVNDSGEAIVGRLTVSRRAGEKAESRAWVWGNDPDYTVALHFTELPASREARHVRFTLIENERVLATDAVIPLHYGYARVALPPMPPARPEPPGHTALSPAAFDADAVLDDLIERHLILRTDLQRQGEQLLTTIETPLTLGGLDPSNAW